MNSLGKSRLPCQALLFRPCRKALQTLLQIGVLLPQPDGGGRGHHQATQIKALKRRRRSALGQTIEVEHTGTPAGLQQPPRHSGADG